MRGRAPGLQVLSNRAGWSQDRLKELASILEREFEVSTVDSASIQTTEEGIPRLLITPGPEALFRALFTEMGADVYDAFRAALEDQWGRFQKAGAPRQRVHIQRQYEGTQATVVLTDDEGNLALPNHEGWSSAIETVDAFLDEHGPAIPFLRLRWSPTEGWLVADSIIPKGRIHGWTPQRHDDGEDG